MASGAIVGQIIEVVPPAANGAALLRRAGGSSPAENVLIWSFDASTIEYVDLKVVLDGYDGGGLTLTLPWSAASATSGNVIWQAAIRAVPDDAEDIDASHSYDYNSVTDAAASASGELSYPVITFTDGADMDSWSDGALAIVRIRRNASDGGDTMTGDAELWAVVIRES